MIKTQIQIPDELYRRAKQVAKEREMSFAEVTRRGLEYITSVYPERREDTWELPVVNEEKGGDRISLAAIQEAPEADRDART
jgi:predicted CopG family antitoxin